MLRIVACSLLLTACATNATPAPQPERDVYIIPLATHDLDLICVETWDQPRRRCVTAGEVRALAHSVRTEQ